MEKAISFLNNKNQRLYGILHIPEKESILENRIGINILNPGLKNRVAPNRLNVKLARKLCKLGFFVLRFDPHGIGDSKGQFMGKNESLMDLWGMIQKGSFVDDTIVSNSFFISEVGIKKLILIGQCGAGVTAGLSASIDHRINSLILIDTPFRISSSEIKMTQTVIDSYSGKQLMKEHFKGIFKFKWISNIYANGLNLSWLKEKYQVIRKMFCLKSFYKNEKIISDRFNYKLSNSLKKYMQKEKKIYFLFAENDYSLREFNNDFRYNFLEKSKNIKNNYLIDIIKNANHIYTETKWQEELFKYINSWLKVS